MTSSSIIVSQSGQTAQTTPCQNKNQDLLRPRNVGDSSYPHKVCFHESKRAVGGDGGAPLSPPLPLPLPLPRLPEPRLHGMGWLVLSGAVAVPPYRT